MKTIPRSQALRLAVEAQCDERTIARTYRDVQQNKPIRHMAKIRALKVLVANRYVDPQTGEAR